MQDARRNRASGGTRRCGGKVCESHGEILVATYYMCCVLDTDSDEAYHKASQQHCGKNSSAFVVLAVCVPDFNSEEQSVFVFQILVKLSGVWFRFNNGMEENLWREGL